MTELAQQVNLYRVDSAEQAIDAGARILLMALIGAFSVVTLLAVAGEFYLARVSSEREEVAAQLRQQQVKVDRVQASFPTTKEDPFLRSELERLEQRARQLSGNLGLLRNHVSVSGQGFSPVFDSLARHTLDGIWLSKVGVASEGAAMWLRGHTLEPELVPRLLQTLSDEPAFSGRSFRRVSFKRRETDRGSLVDFELRSAEPAEVGDAG